MNRQVPRSVVVAALVITGVVALWILGSTGEPAPEIAGPTTQGETFRLSDHKGKVVLVNFWATWCGPCRMEIPDLVALQERYGPRGFTVVGVSTDDQGLDYVRAFIQKSPINYPILVVPDGVKEAYGGVPAIPASFLINKRGQIVYSVEGLTTEAALAPRIEGLL